MPSVAILNLHQAEKITEDLMILIHETIRSLEPEEKSRDSLVLNVSKITVSKVPYLKKSNILNTVPLILKDYDYEM